MFFNFEDKYFRDLGLYNKDLVPHKQAFFKDCQGLTVFLRELLQRFSFNLNNNTSSFRWGKRYFSKDDKKFNWTTSSDGIITNYVWDNNLHQRKQVNVRAYFSDKMIEDHFLSCFKPLRKPAFYYKLTRFEKDELQNDLTALINIQKIDNKTYGSSQMPNSDILLIDIDNYPDNKAIDKLRTFLNHCDLKVSDLIFIEQNVFKGGIHAALKLPFVPKDEFYHKTMDYFTSLGCRIECAFTNGILRFPLSYEYVALKHDEKILDADEFISNEFWEETFESYVTNLNWNTSHSKVLEALNTNNTKTLRKELEKTLKKAKYNNYWSKHRSIIKRVNEEEPIKPRRPFYKITAGKRYETLSKLIPYCKLLGYSLNQTIDIIYENTESSKDLARWSRGHLYDNIKDFYNKCPEPIFYRGECTSYIKNEGNLPKYALQVLSDKRVQKHLVNKFIANYIKERNRHNAYINRLSDEKVDILKQVLPIMFKEIIGKMFYEIKNPKEFINGINEELGFQLPDCLLSSIQEYAINKAGIDSLIAKTSLQYLKKAILDTLGLVEIGYKNRKRNWQLGSCKSFRVKAVYDIDCLLTHFYNSVYNDEVYKEYINNLSNMSSIILYISLQENQWVNRLTGEIIEKMDDPPPK